MPAPPDSREIEFDDEFLNRVITTPRLPRQLMSGHARSRAGELNEMRGRFAEGANFVPFTLFNFSPLDIVTDGPPFLKIAPSPSNEPVFGCFTYRVIHEPWFYMKTVGEIEGPLGPEAKTEWHFRMPVEIGRSFVAQSHGLLFGLVGSWQGFAFPLNVLCWHPDHYRVHPVSLSDALEVLRTSLENRRRMAMPPADRSEDTDVR